MAISKYWIINLSLASFDANVSSVSLISKIAAQINTPINNWSLLVYWGVHGVKEFESSFIHTLPTFHEFIKYINPCNGIILPYLYYRNEWIVINVE